MTDERTSVLFAKLAERYSATHRKPCHEMYPDGCWEFEIEHYGSKYQFAMNGHGKEQSVNPPGSMGWTVPPFSCVIFCNGWMICEVNPRFGIVLGDCETIEVKLIEMLSAAAVNSEAAK